MYILASIISSLRVAKNNKKRHRARDRKAEEFQLHPCCTADKHNSKLVSKKKPKKQRDSECTNLLRFSIQINTFSSKSFKYSTKCSMNMEWRCELERYITSSVDLFCCLFSFLSFVLFFLFLNNQKPMWEVHCEHIDKVFTLHLIFLLHYKQIYKIKWTCRIILQHLSL